MAMISTRQLFEEFFAEQQDESYVKRTRGQVYRPEVFAYEEKIGKQLVDMNVDELFDMVSTFKSEGGFSISYTSYDCIAVLYRKIFEYYIDHYEMMKNPWRDAKMRGAAAYERLSSYLEPVTWEIVQNAIDEVYKTNETDRAKYVECVIRLFYNGFERAEEIVRLKESMIDFEKKEINFFGRTIWLDDRCFELLVEIHNMETMSAWRNEFCMASWHDSYFKFPIRKSEESGFNNRSQILVANLINRTIAERLRKALGFEINYRMLYLLGFYDYMVKKWGVEETNRLLTPSRERSSVKKLTAVAREYGVSDYNITHIKRNMRPFMRR